MSGAQVSGSGLYLMILSSFLINNDVKLLLMTPVSDFWRDTVLSLYQSHKSAQFICVL